MNKLEKQIKKLLRKEYTLIDEIGKLERKRIKLRSKRWKLEDQKEEDTYENRT